MTDTLNLGNEIIAGTQDVFSTMLMVELESKAVIDNGKCEIKSNLTSMIGLGGGIRGLLAVHCPGSVAKAITGSFLGMDVADLNDDVMDAIGEIANMVAGNIKVSCAKININVELAIPTTIVGESFHVSGIADADRIIVPFKMIDEIFWVELMYVVSK